LSWQSVTKYSVTLVTWIIVIYNSLGMKS